MSKRTQLFALFGLIIILLLGGLSLKKKFWDKKPTAKVTKKKTDQAPIELKENSKIPEIENPLKKPESQASVEEKEKPQELFKTESQSTESQNSDDSNVEKASISPFIPLKMGTNIRVTEGSQFSLQRVEVESKSGQPLTFFWSLKSGNPQAIVIEGHDQLHPKLIIKDIAEDEIFKLALKVSDGTYSSYDEIEIKASAVKLETVLKKGGSLDHVIHLGQNYFVTHGQEALIYDENFQQLKSFPIQGPIKRLFALHQYQQNDYVYFQNYSKKWFMFRQNSLGMSELKAIDGLGQDIISVKQFMQGNEAFVYVLKSNVLQLFSLKDPQNPQLKNELKHEASQLITMAHYERFVYLADENEIHVYDFNTKRILASLPAGGYLSDMDSFELKELNKIKGFLLLGIGKDLSKRGRMDYGLRLFSISEEGKLYDEGRIRLEGNPQVRKVHLIPGSQFALVNISQEKKKSIRLIDLKLKKELSVKNLDQTFFAQVDEIETGKIEDTPIMALADGDSLRVFNFSGLSTGQASIEERLQINQISAARSVKILDENRTLIWDELNSSFVIVDNNNLNIEKAIPLERIESLVLEKTSKATSLFSIVKREGKSFLMQLSSRDASWSINKTPLDIQGFQATGIDRVSLGAQSYLAISAMPNDQAKGGALFIRPSQADQGIQSGEELSSFPKTSILPFEEAFDVVFSPDAKFIYVASGALGVTAVDAFVGQARSRVRSTDPQASAKKIWINTKGDFLFAAFQNLESQKIDLKIFAIEKGFRMSELSSIPNLNPVDTYGGMVIPEITLSQNGQFLLIPQGEAGIFVYNLFDPNQVTLVEKRAESGNHLSVGMINKSIFLALGDLGLEKLNWLP